jgi:hypothetical protein
VVRRPAAVLAILAAAQAYILLAPSLPVIGDDGDLALLVSASLGTATVLAVAACIAPVSDVPALTVVVALGAGVLVAALNAAHVGASATPVEAAAYAAAGAVFAVGLLTPALAVTLPVFVAIVDVASTTLGGPSEMLAHGETRLGDPLSLAFPDWGTGLPAGRLGISDAVFAGVFLTYARRYGLRPVATAAAMWVGTVAAIVLQLAVDSPMPVLPFMAAGYFAANIDRLPALLRHASAG